MTRIADGFFNLLKVAMVVFLALMVVLVFGNVVLRYGFNKGITISEEMSRMLFVWLTFTSAIVAMREHDHLGMDTLVKHLSPAGKKACFVASHLLILFASALFLQGSWKQTAISYDVGAIAPVTGMSMTLFYGTGVVFSVCAVLLTLAELYRLLAGRLREEELVTVKETFEDTELAGIQGGAPLDVAPEGSGKAAGSRDRPGPSQ
jgi:TRAP-type C4-dicarboxylate transport system permease small subunit